MTDILGPANAVNSVTVRPAETRSFLSLDSWFKDCSSPVADDGTDVTASFFNGVVAALRAMWRGNGMRNDGVTPVVAEVGTDDNGVLLGIQHMIQRGQLIYAADTGAANAIVVSLSPALIEYKAGFRALIKLAANGTGGPTTINFNLLGAKSVKRLDGQDPAVGDLLAGALVEFAYDGTNFQIMNVWSQRPILSAARTYYVNDATGSDSANDGLAVGTPFKTIQKAVDVMSTFDNNGFDVTINVADGTYASVNLKKITGSGVCYLIGNIANASVCIITGSSTAINAATAVGTYNIRGFKVSSSVGNGVTADGAGSNLILRRMDFGTCAKHHMACQRGASLVLEGTIHDAGAYVRISGSAETHIVALGGSSVAVYSQPITITGTPNFSGSYVLCRLCGTLEIQYSSITGAATGTRYSVSENGVCNTFSGSATYLPGNAAGVTNLGGQYN